MMMMMMMMMETLQLLSTRGADLKISRPTLTRYNFDKGGSIFIFFHYYIQKRSAEEDGIKTNTSPQICCCTTLWSARWSTVQHYSTVNSVQSDEKRLITVNVHEEWRMLFLCLFFYTDYFPSCVYNVRLRHICVLSHECHWSWMCQLCVVQCCAKRFSS